MSAKNWTDVALNSLAELLEHFQIATCDLALVGDGSGATWKIGGGWACLAVHTGPKPFHKLFYGSLYPGTVNIAELLPYVHALGWYISDNGPAADELKRVRRPLAVHVFSDSEVTCRIGNGARAKSNVLWWGALREIRQWGLEVRFHHAPRTVISANILTDAVSRAARLRLQPTDVLADAYRALGFPDSITPERVFPHSKEAASTRD